jgi:hypothetical protein
MSYNGSGTFQINTSGQPVVAGTVISSTAFNALTADLATGLSTAITKDGQTTTTARIPFAAGINSSLTTDSSSTTTGSIITAGGVGIAKALWVGGLANFASTITYGGVTLSAAVTGTGKMVLDTSPTLVTPVLGVATATSINKLTLTAPATSATLTVADGASLVTSGAYSLTLTATALTNVTLPTTGTLATLAGTETLTGKTLTSPIITNPLITEIRETATVSATAATGTIAYDALTQVVLYYTTDASGNFTVNFRGNSGTSLDSVMSTGQSLSATFLVTNGATAYYNSAVQVDGSSVTPKWQGGSAPTSGNASSIDSYTYVIIKTGSATFTVLASVTKFA